ncbi:MAG: hypothetical protein AB1798_10705 [Spirochaetota bacterium]
MKKQAENWLEAAFDDIKTIEKIRTDKTLTNMIAFHACLNSGGELWK